MNRIVSGCLIDNEAFNSAFFGNFKKVTVEAWDILKDGCQIRALRPVPAEIKNREQTSCDHGGLVLGSLLNTVAKDTTLSLLLAIKEGVLRLPSGLEKQRETFNFWVLRRVSDFFVG